MSVVLSWSDRVVLHVLKTGKRICLDFMISLHSYLFHSLGVYLATEERACNVYWSFLDNPRMSAGFRLSLRPLYLSVFLDLIVSNLGTYLGYTEDKCVDVVDFRSMYSCLMHWYSLRANAHELWTDLVTRIRTRYLLIFTLTLNWPLNRFNQATEDKKRSQKPKYQSKHTSNHGTFNQETLHHSKYFTDQTEIEIH